MRLRHMPRISIFLNRFRVKSAEKYFQKISKKCKKALELFPGSCKHFILISGVRESSENLESVTPL